MKIIAKLAVVALCVLFVAPTAFSSEITGKIQRIRISGSDTALPRVSIYMGGGAECGLNGWYAYESMTVTLDDLRTRALLAAYQSKQQVRIAGDNECLWPGVERVTEIDVISD